MEYRNELAIAQKAEQMLTSALQNRTLSFAEHYEGKKQGEPSLKEAHAKAKVKRYGRKRDGNQQIFMRSLAIRMAKHGFVQHYGVDTVRAGGERKSKKGTPYRFAAHYFKMEAKPFIDKAIEQSGVAEFVAENIGQLRADAFGEELLFPLTQFSK